jgi:hypothetical protein
VSDFEEQTITALRTLFAQVQTLHHIDFRDILKPDIYRQYVHTLQQAYDSLTTVEDALIALGMKLEYEHFRLGSATDELEPLMIHPHSKSEKVMEILDQKMPPLDSTIDPT